MLLCCCYSQGRTLDDVACSKHKVEGLTAWDAAVKLLAIHQLSCKGNSSGNASAMCSVVYPLDDRELVACLNWLVKSNCLMLAVSVST
jgi:hypothetical protein